MATVAPFHSKLPGTTVYHSSSLCSEANNIELSNRERGTGNLPLCSHCARLG